MNSFPRRQPHERKTHRQSRSMRRPKPTLKGWLFLKQLVSIPLMLTIALLSSNLAFALPAAPPEAPEPEATSGCDWYGELTESINLRYTFPAEGQTQTKVVEKKFSSVDDPSTACGAFYSETYYDSYLDLGQEYCYPGGLESYLGSTYYSVVVEGTGHGTGTLEGFVTGVDTNAAAMAGGSGQQYSLTTTTEGLFPCGQIDSSTVTTLSEGVRSQLPLECATERAVPNLQVQAFAGACTLESVLDHGLGSSTTTTTTWTWRFRQKDCNPQIDSDRGGVSDCEEYRLRSNPANPADDGPPLDSDGDSVLDTSDQCPGTPTGTPVNSVGCTPDTDGDGVPDPSDQCPGTPTGTPVNSVGCTLDTDGDGVPDPSDQCPGTPAGSAVDTIGCPQNRPPDAVDDSASTLAGQPVSISPLANDTDPDGDSLTLQSCISPAGGAISVAEGWVEFTPDRGYSGTTAFTCTVSDPHGATDTATVTVTVSGGTITLTGAYGYTGSVLPTGGANVAGTDAVTAIGPAELLEGATVCMTSTWKATATVRIATTLPVHWNGQTRPFVDSRLSGYVIEKKGKGLFNNLVTEVMTYNDCATGTTAAFAPFPESPVLSVTAAQPLVSLEHSVSFKATLKNGTTLELSVPSSTTKAGNSVDWAKMKTKIFRF